MARVIDDAMPGFAEFQARVMAPGFPWHYARQTRQEDGGANPWLNGWVHLVLDNGVWFSEHHDLIMDKLTDMFVAIGEPVMGIHRIRAVLNTLTDRYYLNGAHVDLQMPHKTALLYLNDADGDTVIYRETWQAGYAGPFTEGDRVAPKAGRLVLFDGLRFHTGTTPVKTPRRVVLNINYE
jgi:hypothetical protein